MKQRVILRAWDRSRRYVLDVESGAIERYQGDDGGVEVSGFLREFAVGKSLTVYKTGGTWYLQEAGGSPIPLGDESLQVSVRRFGFLRALIVLVRGRRSLHVESRAVALVASRLDPTYDSIDQFTDDFAAWLVERAAEAGATWAVSLQAARA